MNHFLRSLPLVASALGRKYGLQVVIGGDKAGTDGQTIVLPQLPLDSSPELVSLARGFLDHEAAHIRASDLRAVKAARLTTLEHHIWNIIEDWRVEEVLGRQYPGCRQNFQWLLRHLLKLKPEDRTAPLDLAIPNWLLFKIRSWAVPDLEGRAEHLTKRLETELPGLRSELEPVLAEIRADCPDTRAAIGYACGIVDLLKRFGQSSAAQGNSPAPPNGPNGPAGPGGPQDTPQDAHQTGPQGDCPGSIINSLLARPKDKLPTGVGERLERILDQAGHSQAARKAGLLQVAQVAPLALDELSPEDLAAARSATLALRCRLQSLLQTLTLPQIAPGYQGRLDTNGLYKLFVNQPRVFRRSGQRAGLDTAIHLLLDASGSMGGPPIELVSQSAYALCEALTSTPGLNVGATVFPGAQRRRTIQGRSRLDWCSVAPLLQHGQSLHRRFQLHSEGDTPMGEAIWWVMQQMAGLREGRKIILILTDGAPNCRTNTLAAIGAAQRLGFEIYGLGLKNDFIKNILPGRSLVIDRLPQLPSALFKLLGQALSLNQTGGTYGQA